jgi:hypothetical protein
MSWAVAYFAKLLNHMGRNSKGWVIFTTFLAWITGGIPALVTSVMVRISDAVAALTFSELGSVDFSALEYIAYVNALIPLTEFVYLVGIYVTAWVTVISIRWVKSFVPTIAN